MKKLCSLALALLMLLACLTFTKGIDIRDYAEKITDIIVEG